ncbi:hypothetical protein AAVH_26964 [Aphelenchoides avenae]|nr:hypothetical protein AAVH_26964 [Aphelenchus avenae]
MSRDTHAVASTSRLPDQSDPPARRPHGIATRVAVGGTLWTPVYPARENNTPEDSDVPSRLGNGHSGEIHLQQQDQALPSASSRQARSEPTTRREPTLTPASSGRSVWDEIVAVLRQGNEDMERRLAAKEEDNEILRRQNRDLYYRCQALEDERRFAQERHERELSGQRAETSRVQQLLTNAELEASRLTDDNRRLQDAASERGREAAPSATDVGQLLQVASELERLANDQKVAVSLAQQKAKCTANAYRESVDECARLRRSAERLTRELEESKRESTRIIEGQSNALRLAFRAKDDAERALNDLKLKLNESSKRLRDKRCIRCAENGDAPERLEQLQWDYDESVKNVCELMDRIHAKDQKIDELERLVEILREQFRTAGIPVEDTQTSSSGSDAARITVGTPPPSTSGSSSGRLVPSESSSSTRLRPSQRDLAEPSRKKRALGSEDDGRPRETLPSAPYDDGPPELVESSSMQETDPDVIVIDADQATTSTSTNVGPHGSAAQDGPRRRVRLTGPPMPRVLPNGVQGPPARRCVVPSLSRVLSPGPPAVHATASLTTADAPGPSVGSCLTALLAPQPTRSSPPLPAPRVGQRRPRRTTSSTTESEPGNHQRRRTVPAQQPRQWRDVQLLPISTNPPVFYLVDERRFVEVYTDLTTGEQMTRDADPLALQSLVNQQLRAAQATTASIAKYLCGTQADT